MPKRPRSHRIETESELAFAEALPENLYLQLTGGSPEYGIDGEVEEFDPDTDEATGLRFAVQLKATDEEDLKKALKERLPLKTLAYYRAQAVPVLMVRYVAARGEIYARWAHEFDPYYEHMSETHLIFNWSDDNLWTEQTGERLLAEARQFHAIKNARLELPIKIALELPADGAHSFSPVELRLALQAQAARRSDLFRVVGEDEEADLRLRLSDDELHASLSTLYTFTIHFENEYAPGEAGEQAAADALAAAAFVLARAGHAALASRAATEYLPNSLLAAIPPCAREISSAIAYSGRVGDAVKLVDALDADPSEDVVLAGFIILVGVLSRAPDFSPEDRKRLADTLERRIGRRIADGDSMAAAGDCIGLAHLCGAGRDHAGAVAAFERARELDPGYEGRSYFWEEFGGALFLSDQPGRAADAYAKAIELGSDDEYLVNLHADALLYAGHFAEAYELFDDADPDDVAQSAWAYVKARALAFVLSETGTEEQSRQVEEASKRAGELGPGLDERELAEEREAIFSLDAVSPLGWFNLARALLDREQPEEAKHAYLVTAVMQEGDVEAWINVAVLSVQTDDDDLFATSVITGSRLNRDTYMSTLAGNLRAQGLPSAERDALLAEFTKLVEAGDDASPPAKRPFKIRFNRPGEETEVIEVPDLI